MTKSTVASVARTLRERWRSRAIVDMQVALFPRADRHRYWTREHRTWVRAPNRFPKSPPVARVYAQMPVRERCLSAAGFDSPAASPAFASIGKIALIRVWPLYYQRHSGHSPLPKGLGTLLVPLAPARIYH